MTSEQADRHDRVYREGWALIEGQLLLDGAGARAHAKLGWSARRRLRRAATCFHKALELAPTNWSTMWALGKIHQRLGDMQTALAWFARAHATNPNQADVAREAGICATQLGVAADAVLYSRAAIAAAPEDAGLVANLALALLIDGQVGEARHAAGEACSRAPQDSASRRVLELVEEVAAGRRPMPTSGRDLGL